MTEDESHLPVAQQSLVYRLRKRAEIRRSIKTRKSVQEGQRDRIADLLDEAAEEIEMYYRVAYEQGVQARQNGWERSSPYRGVKAEKYWYAGYDEIDYASVK